MVSGSAFEIIVPLVYAILVVALVVLVVLVVLGTRLALAATKTLDVVTEERRLRIELLIAQHGGDLGQ